MARLPENNSISVKTNVFKFKSKLSELSYWFLGSYKHLNFALFSKNALGMLRSEFTVTRII